MAEARPVVLVVEDEQLNRMLAVEALHDAGFDTIEAADAAEALAILQSRGGPVRAVFSDVNMPGEIDGLRLARLVDRGWPHIAVLLASGVPLPTVATLPPRARYLPKPYALDRLVTHLREMTG